MGRTPVNNWEARAYGKCHRKYTARFVQDLSWSERVRVKWCGKSAPHFWQQKWQGKPRSEQDQIGTQGRDPR